MQRFLIILLLVAIIGGGGYFLTNYEVKQLEDGWKITPRDVETVSTPWNASPTIPARTGDTIKIASFNIQVFGRTKMSKPHVMEVLCKIVRDYDLVAVQEIRSKDQDIVPRFVDQINATGRHFDFVIGPRQGDTNSKEQYAYIFDRETIEVDRAAIYSVQDPSNLLHRPPLVAQFRVRGPPTDQAFTFSLVNVHVDPDEVEHELSYMDDVFRRVRSDGRNEDDIIVLGDFNAGDKRLSSLASQSGLNWVLQGIPTNVLQTAQYDNILYHQLSTTEFTGRCGIDDFLRRFNMTTEQATEVSDHFPIWAEFSVVEGGQPGRVASEGPAELR